MGNTCDAKQIPKELPDADDLKFFLQLGVKWLEVALSDLKQKADIRFSFVEPSKLSWRLYFSIFKAVKDVSHQAAVEQEKKYWHPATQGFWMGRAADQHGNSVSPNVSERHVGSDIADDFTNDEDSDDDSSVSSSSNKQAVSSAAIHAPRSTPSHWNPEITSPIFFGFSTEKDSAHKDHMRKKENSSKERETRALNKAMAARSVVVDSMEKKAQQQYNFREKKIEELKASYESETKKRDDEYNEGVGKLEGEFLRLIKDQKRKEDIEALQAFTRELNEMVARHEEKTSKDRAAIKDKRDELEAFKDLEMQETPAAERLEQFSRLEIHRCGEELRKTMADLTRVQKEFETIHNEYQERLSAAAASSQANQKVDKRVLELRSMANVAETRLREAQAATAARLEDLLDANALLAKAVKEKEQQREFLPLFKLAMLADQYPMVCDGRILLLAAVVLSAGSFDEKLSLMIRIFCSDFSGGYNFEFVLSLGTIVANVLKVLHLVPPTLSTIEVEALLQRIFASFDLRPGTDSLSDYEAKALFRLLLSKSELLMKLFHITVNNGEGARAAEVCYSTYQLNQMASLTAYSTGILDWPSCVDRIHYSHIQERPTLSKTQKRTLHERALSMGLNDPLAPDYSHFFIKVEKKSSYRVEGLNTGLYTHVEYFAHKKREDAAIKIQSIARLFLDKKLSERAAKQMALMEAKATAVKELKARILREYQKRESARGVGKMKWDAEVRMRQAKLRATGQSVSRSDVVMIMVEEAIAVANKSLDEKFAELQLEDDMKTLKLLQPKDVNNQIAFNPSLFDIVDECAANIVLFSGDKDPSSSPSDGPAAVEDKTSAQVKPETDLEAKPETDNGEVPPEPPMDIASGAQSSSSEMQSERVGDIIRARQKIRLLENEELSMAGGTSNTDGQGTSTSSLQRGETLFEAQLRRVLSMAETRGLIYLYSRLRLLDPVVTKFKAEEILYEMPSKRLLLKYIAASDLAFLQEDLLTHFKFKKHYKRIARYFRNIEESDIEFGILRRHVFSLQSRIEKGLLNSYTKLLMRSVSAFRDSVELRKESNSEGKTVMDFVREELARLTTAVSVHRSEFYKVVANIATERAKAQKIALSLDHCEQQIVTVQEFNQSRGLASALPASMRFDWMRRYKGVMRSSSSTLGVLKELSALMAEFLEVVRNDSTMIVLDLYQPEHARSIPVYDTKTVNGRADYAGRGVAGRKAWFMAHNIFYRVALDYDGYFNGSDEYAAKAASNDRVGASEFLNSGVDRLIAPLVATVDVFGFRVLAVARLPIQHIVFDDNGEIQRISEDLVHGVLNQGNSFINRSKLADKLLKLAATKLNIAEHNVKGLRDLSSSSTFVSGFVKVYKSPDDDFYLRNCGAALPCEPPIATPHFYPTPRHQSIFWRRMRPEYLRTLKSPLCSDAFMMLVHGVPDAAQHHQVQVAAISQMLENIIPSFVKSLLTRSYHLPLVEGLGINIAEELHFRGINVRHLGYMRSLIWRSLPGTVSVYHGEKFIRTSHNLSVEVEDGQEVVIDGTTFIIQATKRNPITTSTLPISHKHRSDSINSAVARCGKVQHSQNCEEVRLVLLGEMVARCVKNIIRFQLRTYNQSNRGCSMQFMRALVAEHLNFLTSSSNQSSVFFEDIVYEGILERFGKYAVRISERKGLANTIRPILPFVIRRVLEMCGVRLSNPALSTMALDPCGLSFCLQDVVEIRPIVRHNVAAFAFAEAMMLAEEADNCAAKGFTQEILRDDPTAFFNLSERKGARIAINHGRLSNHNALISAGCELEHPGPVKADRFIRAASFHPLQRATVDCNHHETIVASSLAGHFSIEVFFRCTGGKDTNRTLIDNGRYRLGVNRENILFFTFYEGVHTISLRCCPIDKATWYHVVGTFDGTCLRCFVNTDLCFELELRPILAQKDAVILARHKERLQAIAQDEVLERTRLKEKTISDANIFFQTKEGLAALKRISQRLVEVDGFNPEQLNETEEPLTGKQKRAIIVRKAKDEFVEELFQKNKVELSARFEQLLADEEDHYKKTIQNGRLRVFKPFRVGGALPDASNREGSDYFHGHVSCVAIYDRCLSADRIRVHFFASQRQTHVDAQRLYARAAAKFTDAFSFSFAQGLFDSETEKSFLETYARSLCSFLYLDPEVRNKVDVEAAKTRLVDLLSVLALRQLPDVIASIIKAIPRDPDFADIIVESLLHLRNMQRHYLSSSLILGREMIAFLPFELALIAAYRPFRYFEAAAYVFQQVVRDHNFSFIYGEVDLSWITELSSPLLVISIVKNAYDDHQLRVVRLMELMSVERMVVHRGLPSDSDVQALVQNSPLLEGFDLTNCAGLTDSALEYLNRIDNIRMLTLTRCGLITDRGIAGMTRVLPRLERLSLEGVSLLTDEGALLIAEHCHKLAHLNLNGCSEITAVSVHQIIKSNRFVTHLKLSRVLLTDEGVVDLASLLSHMKLVELDISYCSAVTDVGVAALSEACSSIRNLNLAGLNRVSFRSVQLITTKCWELQSLNLEDIFLANDKVFIYEAAIDGRAAANARMLVSMKAFAITECLALTDAGMHALSERCRSLETLCLRGCAKLSDASLHHFADPSLCADSKFPLAATLMVLDLSFCTRFTAAGLEAVLSQCQALNELDLSGLVSTVDDQCVRMVGRTCPTVQSLKLRQCLLLTDIALCYLAEALWLETLDISGCHRLSDHGIELIAEAFTGLQYIGMNKVKNITTRSIRFLQQCCKGLRKVQCQDCPLVSFEDLDLDQWNLEIVR